MYQQRFERSTGGLHRGECFECPVQTRDGAVLPTILNNLRIAGQEFGIEVTNLKKNGDE